MAFSSLLLLAIGFATAATLNSHGVTDIVTSAQAAEALRPIAGEFALARWPRLRRRFSSCCRAAAPRHGQKDLPRPCPAGRCNRTAVPAVSSAAGSRRLHLQKLWTSIRPAFWPNAAAPMAASPRFSGDINGLGDP